MQTILVVDDNEVIQQTLSIRLRAEGYEVLSALDATTAVSMAVRYRPDLVLLDYVMPAGNGLDVLQMMVTAMAGIPVIFLTGHPEPDLPEKAARLGAEGFLTKPFDPKTLLDTIRDVLERRSGSPPLARS
jgi:DNA-binding response OmpR family regulator